MQWCSERQGSLQLAVLCMVQSSCCRLKVREQPNSTVRRKSASERGQCQKPSASHLCSELCSTLLTEPLSRYAFGHSWPHGRHLELHQSKVPFISCLLTEATGNHPLFTLTLSPPAGSEEEHPQCAAVRPLPLDSPIGHWWSLYRVLRYILGSQDDWWQRKIEKYCPATQNL